MARDLWRARSRRERLMCVIGPPGSKRSDMPSLTRLPSPDRPMPDCH
jgi:hypothetical protein